MGHHRTAISHRRIRARSDSGVASVEFSIAFVAFLIAVLVAFHFWMHFIAAEAAADAASEVLEAMSTMDSAADPHAVAAQILDVEPGIESGWSLNVDRDPAGNTTVTVRVQSHRFMAGLPVDIEQSATGITDRFISQSDR